MAMSCPRLTGPGRLSWVRGVLAIAIHIAVFVVCLAVLARVADVIVDAVLEIARRHRIPPAIAGATLAAAATSAPELGTNLFALAAARGGDSEVVASIGLGSIFGSAMFNLTVIVGLAGLFGNGQLTRRIVVRECSTYALSIVAVLAFVLYLGTPHNALGRYEGLICVALYGAYAVILQRDRARSQSDGDDELDAHGDDAAARGGSEAGSGQGSQARPRRPGLRLVASIAFIAVACHFLVDSTRHLATAASGLLALDEAAAASFISLVVVAAATSIPDALTSVAAARRGHTGLAVGNAIGSNTFDMLICTGLPAAIFGGYATSDLVAVSGGWLLGSAILVPLLLVRGWCVSRTNAVTLLVIYAAFVVLVGLWPVL